MSGAVVTPAVRPRARATAATARWMAGGIFVAQVAAGVPAPLYPEYAARWHMSAAALAGLFSALIVGVIVALLLAPRARVAVGARTALLCACALAAAGTALYLAAPGPGWLLAGSFLQGAAIGAFSGVAPAVMSQAGLSGGARTVGTLVTAANAVGLAVGPVWSGAMRQFGPWSHQSAFVVVLLAIAAVGVAVALTVPPEERVRSRSAHRPEPRAAAHDRGRFVVACLAGFSGFAVGGLYSSLGALVAHDVLGVGSVTLLGLVPSLLFMANACASTLILRLGAERAWAVGLVLLPVGLLAAAAACTAGVVALFFVATIVSGAGQGLAIAAGTAVASSAPSVRSASNFFLVCYAGTAIPALAAGAVASVTSLQTTLYLFAAGIAVVCVAAIRGGRTR